MRGHSKRGLAAILAAVLAVAACGGARESDSAPSRSAATPVVVDTDMSTDDVLALLYLLGRRDIDVRAVAVSGTGIVDCPAGARNARALLAFAGRSDLPVGCGRADPLAGANGFPPEWRTRADDLFGVNLPPAPSGRIGDAVDVLRHAIDDAHGKVTVLSLAPMTDTALLLRPGGDVRSRIARIVAMGGAVGVPGNIGPGHERSEWNLWIDPLAAREVLASGIPTTLVGLDATNDVPATTDIWHVLDGRSDRRRARVAARIMASSGMVTGGQYFWDPLAATAVAQPEALTFASRRMRIVTTGADAGRLVADPRGAPVRLALRADRRSFERQFVSALAGGTRFTIPAPPRRAVLRCTDAGCAYDGPRRTQAGQAALDTVNDSAQPFAHVIGRLHEGKTVADLRRYARSLDGRDVQPPVWLSIVATGQTPPHSRMTWVVRAMPGDYVLVAATQEAPRTWAIAPIAVRSQR